MGAKQSKRSVDISGKEAEGAGEVAAAGAGGEGRMEALADADALKPQINGDAHIQPPEETDKEKQLDSGTPENEKDATTEKETKEEEAIPIVNGESDSKVDNGESTPSSEDSKKPKKEKVKKKWSLRSISFSRKDKPKQEKKVKEDEPKTNGDTEKVPEEAVETPETIDNKASEDTKSTSEIKDEKTPETPVTEPITNGSSTPESPKVETPAAGEPAAPENRPEPKTEIEPEQLPVNGLSLEEPKKDEPVETPVEESKPEETPAETTEKIAAPEIPAKAEDPLPVSDKIANLIPEVPTVPELMTETLQESTTDVAVSN